GDPRGDHCAAPVARLWGYYEKSPSVAPAEAGAQRRYDSDYSAALDARLCGHDEISLSVAPARAEPTAGLP
ncbi:MAG: hypothetical protein AAF441_28930, partial [Pseudomonadota bacterium]